MKAEDAKRLKELEKEHPLQSSSLEIGSPESPPEGRRRPHRAVRGLRTQSLPCRRAVPPHRAPPRPTPSDELALRAFFPTSAARVLAGAGEGPPEPPGTPAGPPRIQRRRYARLRASG
jgi:hypothetical protein